ncbi:MAG TPA: class I SAM-dependent methyltransferase [Thermoanaerobaculia bacterium]
MAIAVLYPRYDHPAIEERYASWQTQMLLRRGQDAGAFIFYDRDELAADVAADVETEFVLVITDPLLLPSSRFAVRLRDALAATDAEAALPMSNEGQNPAQRRGPLTPYLTLRELQASIEEVAAQPRELTRIAWDASDPAAFVCRTSMLAKLEKPLHTALAGRNVAIVTNEYMHRWTSLRGQTRYDLLDRIGRDAKSVLEFGCGEAPLGEALKRRQKCRVVGIELDPDAAAIAEKRIDAVYRGDVREIVEILDEQFDWIIGGDIVEHLDEPWSFLADLRHITSPGGHLLLSLPNLANAAVVSDLLRGRFDYVYMGLTCVGHVRFFTKQSIEDMLTIAGWKVVEIAPQDLLATPARDQLLGALDAGGFDYSREDLLPTGYYVIAQNA